MRVKAARSGIRREAGQSGPNWRLSDNIMVSHKQNLYRSLWCPYFGRPAHQLLILAGTAPAQIGLMIQMHSRPKEQREAVRNLVHLVLTRDMGTFNPERFKDWIKDVDA